MIVQTGRPSRRRPGRCFAADSAPGGSLNGSTGNALVRNIQDVQVFDAAGRAKDDAIARARLHQRARQRRHPADVVQLKVDLVGADDADGAFDSRGIAVAHGRAEEDLRRCPPGSRTFRIDHFRGVDAFGEKANAPIDLAEPPFSVLVVGVFAAIAVARGPRDDLRHRRPFLGQQKAVLVLEPLQAARRDVVLDANARCVALGNPGEALAHTALPIQSRLLGRAACYNRMFLTSRPRRPEAQDVALSRLKHGFESRRGRTARAPSIPSNSPMLRVTVRIARRRG